MRCFPTLVERRLYFDIEEVGKPIKFKWGKCPLATASFGHGITTTLLQLAKAYSIIVNGGYDIEPKLISYSKQFRSPTDLTPSQAKVKGGKNGLKLNQNQLLFWDKTLAMMIQTNICNYKYNNYEQVRNDLLKSNDKVLIHSARTLGPWNGRAKYNNNELTVLGENKLGKIWMNVRK